MKSFSKLKKCNDSYTINRYDNGFMIECGGRDEKDDWVNCKVICSSEEELLNLVKELNKIPTE